MKEIGRCHHSFRLHFACDARDVASMEGEYIRYLHIDLEMMEENSLNRRYTLAV